MTLVFAHQVRHHADARAFERVAVQQVRIALRYPAVAESGDWIRWVVAGHHAEQYSGVGDGAGDRPDLVLREAVRHDAGAAYQASRGAYAHETVGGSRRADRLARIAPRAEQPQVRCDRGAGPAARAAWRAREVVRIEYLAAEAAARHPAPRELLEIGLGQD